MGDFFLFIDSHTSWVIAGFSFIMIVVTLCAILLLHQARQKLYGRAFKQEVLSGMQAQKNRKVLYHIAADVGKQVVDNMIQEQYLNLASKLGNILPPLGMMGTILGLGALFIRKAEAAVNTDFSGMAIALLTTLIGMSLFVVVEVITMYTQRCSTKKVGEIMTHAKYYWQQEKVER